MIRPLGVLIRNNLSGQYIRLDSQVENIDISTSVPGGFGTFTFQIPERSARTLVTPLESFYACDVIVSDQNGQSIFEGILTDVKKHSDTTDAYYECDAQGWQVLLNNPYKGMSVERGLSWDQMGIQYFPTLARPDVIQMSAGQVDATDATKVGFRMDVPSGIAVTGGWRNGVQVFFPVGTRVHTLYADISYDTNRTAQFNLNIYEISDAGAVTLVGTIVGPGLTAIPITVTAFTACRGIIIEMACSSGGTTSAPVFASFYNVRVLENRVGLTGTTSSEPVYGHELISNIVNQSLLPNNFFGIDTDFTYQFPQFSYPISDTQRNALDAVTAYYNRYWAVWEDKRFYWSTWSLQNSADWIVSRDGGAQIDIDPSIVNAARVVRVQWTDAAGIQQEYDVADTNQDNSYIMAGASQTTVVDLGIQGLASAAAQLGSVYFPDHSYEVVGGTITIDAQARCFSQTYNTTLPAYRIRAGDSVRVRDGSNYGNVFNSTSWNRSTLFRITATDLDWDNQVMKLTIDNSQASLDQLLGRIQNNLSAKFGT